jgi:hypothetical protein
VAVAPRPRPEVVLPTMPGLRVFADDLREVTLSWPAALAGAAVEVATDPELRDLVMSGPVTGAQVTVPVSPRGELYWRVTGGSRTLSGQARFEADRGRSVLDLERPHNLVSDAGPVTTVYFQSALPALTFAFAPRPGASRYRVRVFRAEDLERAVLDREVRDTRLPADASLFQEGRYVWQALALDAQGRALEGGRMNQLALVYDNALTALAIGRPRPGEPVSGEGVDTSGVAPLGSKLYINGRPAPLDDKGRFGLRVGTSPALVYRLVGRDGLERYWIRRVKVRS